MNSRLSTSVLVALALLSVTVFVTSDLANAQMTKIKMGTSVVPPTLDTITPYVALEKGFFRKYGLNVQIVEFRGDTISTKALLAGDVDAIQIGATSAIVSASKGAKIKLWMVLQPVTPYHFVARKDSGTTFQALVGKTVAVSGIGAISYHIPRIVLARSGVDPEKLNYAAVGSPTDRFKALLAGKVDATVVTNTEAAKLANYPEIIDLVTVPKVVPEIVYEFGMAREDFIQKNPETIYKLTRALIEANRWIAANKAGTVEVAVKILPDESADVLSRSYDMTDPRLWGVNGDMSEATYNYTLDFLLKVGYLNNPLPYNEFFDRRFVDRVLKELGRN